MWELIRANKRNSIVLMALMAAVLLLLGFIIGIVFFGPDAGFYGLIIATGVWLILLMVSFAGGDQILLTSSRAKPVTHDVHPQLFNVVEEMSIAAALPMPKVYIIADPAPNAFATGRNPKNASVAVTAGLLGRLNRDQLQGVVAHEMSHILHRDILFVTLAGIMLGSIVLLSHVFLRGMFYSSMGSRRRYSSGGGGGGQAQIIMLVIAIVAAILAPIMAYLLYFALSRRREYLADAAEEEGYEIERPFQHTSADFRKDTNSAEYDSRRIFQRLFRFLQRRNETQKRRSAFSPDQRGHTIAAGISRSKKGAKAPKAGSAGRRYYANSQRLCIFDVRLRAEIESSAEFQGQNH